MNITVYYHYWIDFEPIYRVKRVFDIHFVSFVYNYVIYYPVTIRV